MHNILGHCEQAHALHTRCKISPTRMQDAGLRCHGDEHRAGLRHQCDPDREQHRGVSEAGGRQQLRHAGCDHRDVPRTASPRTSIASCRPPPTKGPGGGGGNKPNGTRMSGFDKLLPPGIRGDPTSAATGCNQAEWDTEVALRLPWRGRWVICRCVEKALSSLSQGGRADAWFARKVVGSVPTEGLSRGKFIPLDVRGSNRDHRGGLRYIGSCMNETGEIAGILESQPENSWSSSGATYSVSTRSRRRRTCHCSAIQGGGTNLIPIFDKVNELGLTPDALVVLTDGITPFPQVAPVALG